MSLPEGILLFLCVYMGVEVFAMPISALRGKDVRGRVIVWLAASLVVIILWMILTGQRDHTLT